MLQSMGSRESDATEQLNNNCREEAPETPCLPLPALHQPARPRDTAGLTDSLLTCGFWGEGAGGLPPALSSGSPRVRPRSGPSSLLTGSEPAWLELSGCPPATGAPVLCSPR